HEPRPRIRSDLRPRVEQPPGALAATVESFARAATDGRCERARRPLDARPEIAPDPSAGLVRGRGGYGDPTSPRGPLGWASLEHGADPNGTHGLAHAIDYNRVEHVRLMLDAGADAREGPLLVHAVRRECGEEMLRLLAESGARLDAVGGEWSTESEDYRTAYQNAVLRNRNDAAALLAELGASTEVAPEDLAVAGLA